MKARNLTIVIIVFLVIGSMVNCATTGIDESLQAASPRTPRGEDLYTFYTELPKRHKDFFHAIDKVTFNRAYADAATNIDAISDIDFYFTLRRLAAFAADSHTSVGFTQELASQLHGIPAQLNYLEGAWRLSVIAAHRRDLLGSQVLAINDMPIDEVIRLATELFSHDNTTWLRRAIGQQLNLTELYVYLGIADTNTDPGKFIVLPPGSTIKETIILEPISVGTFYQLQLATIYDHLPPTGMSNAPYRLLKLQDGRTVFIQYNVCASYDSYPLATFIKETLTVIDDLQPEHIIVDLRYNSGGDSRLFEPMVDALAQRQKAMDFQLDVLIGEGTFSSALMNAIHFKQRANARLVGTPTGGSVNHFGEVESFILPNSGIPVTYSTKFFIMDPSHPGGSLQPDLVVETDVADMICGVDTVVQAIL